MGARKLIGQKTYWHLLDARRMPTQYELVTSRLLYYPSRGFEVDTPGAAWYRRWQQESAFRCDDWEAFADPRATTYAAYVERQHAAEQHVAAVLDTDDVARADGALPPPWLDVLDHMFAPLRYPCHGLMMLGAYLAQMAPSGRIVVAASMQAADEMRRVHRLAYRLAQVRRVHAELGDGARAAWRDATAWQPARELVERALVAYDWGECFAALALAIKPAWDHLVCEALSGAARAAGDDGTHYLLRSLADDAAWHGQWSAALVRVAVEQRADNRQVLADWLAVWTPRADAAVAALARAYAAEPDAAIAGAVAARRALLRECGLGEEAAS